MAAKRQRVHGTCVTDAKLDEVVGQIVHDTEAIDVHTHLLPPEHGELMLWGIDELLTYHYLVAEFFTALPSMSYDDFFRLSKEEQASLVWDKLFVQRSPISEACQGVITVLHKLGLSAFAETRDLPAIRDWFSKQSIQEHTERIFRLANIRYAVMTNIPYDAEERAHWSPPTAFSSRFRSALRVDIFLTNDLSVLSEVLRDEGFAVTCDGAQSYLRKWIKTFKPEYLMASTPHDFEVTTRPDAWQCTCCDVRRNINPQKPGGFGRQPKHRVGCPTSELSSTTSPSELLEKVLIPIAREHRLPIAIKIGAWRGLKPELRTAGDGLVVFDLRHLAKLLSRYPDVNWLATVLARTNQHELCVLANKFRNLHIYGCWWYCNNPSIVEETTRLRLEMLGFSFTAQHSDCRVLEQLLYKWSHSREVIHRALVPKYRHLLRSGWRLTVDDIQRDVALLLGASYEGFLALGASRASLGPIEG